MGVKNWQPIEMCLELLIERSPLKQAVRVRLLLNSQDLSQRDQKRKLMVAAEMRPWKRESAFHHHVYVIICYQMHETTNAICYMEASLAYYMHGYCNKNKVLRSSMPWHDYRGCPPSSFCFLSLQLIFLTVPFKQVVPSFAGWHRALLYWNILFRSWN